MHYTTYKQILYKYSLLTNPLQVLSPFFKYGQFITELKVYCKFKNSHSCFETVGECPKRSLQGSKFQLFLQQSENKYIACIIGLLTALYIKYLYDYISSIYQLKTISKCVQKFIYCGIKAQGICCLLVAPSYGRQYDSAVEIVSDLS